MKKVFVIGRAPASPNGEIPLILNEPGTEYVARNHCRLTIDDTGNIYLEDLKSTNGTFVNGARINYNTVINENSTITLGPYRFYLTHPLIQAALHEVRVSATPPPSVPRVTIEYADWWQRAGGLLLDQLIFSLLLIPFYFLYIAASVNYRLFPAIYLVYVLGLLLATHLYYAVPISRNGYTYGRKIAGIRYLNADTLQNPGLGQAWVRILGHSISALLLYIGYLMPLWNSRHQALHDSFANTIVVKLK